MGAAQGLDEGGKVQDLDVGGTVILKKSGGPARTPAQRRKIKAHTQVRRAGHPAASKPFADLDATWGKGFFNGDVFAQVVYSAL